MNAAEKIAEARELLQAVHSVRHALIVESPSVVESIARHLLPAADRLLDEALAELGETDRAEVLT